MPDFNDIIIATATKLLEVNEHSVQTQSKLDEFSTQLKETE